MKVKTLREHGNGYGDAYAKAKGDEYVIPNDDDARTLIEEGIVSEVDGGDRASRAGSGAGRASGGDAKERP